LQKSVDFLGVSSLEGCGAPNGYGSIGLHAVSLASMRHRKNSVVVVVDVVDVYVVVVPVLLSFTLPEVTRPFNQNGAFAKLWPFWEPIPFFK
jgi:hypothetical protein